ncbi:Pentatricopeptide repeat (PPR) superfamily protein [Euphorbia peplus]|nr:Pentatricopeptide repeat (PPR) superfamily protein [Euphorbia peplus]
MATKTLFKWSKHITPVQVEKLIRAEKDLHKAKLVFDSATAEYGNGFRHDHTTFGIMISKLVSANQFRPAEQMLERMKDEKCNIVENIFLSICRAYGRVHRPLDAVRVFHRMDEFGCVPTERSYITVFAILVEENQLKVAMRFYKYMKEMGILPSVVSLNILIKALCKNSGTIDSAFEIFREMPNHGCNPDSYTYGTLINGLCRLGKICEAKELFKEMGAKGCSPSVVTYTSLMNGLCQSKNIDEAMGLLEDMISKGIEPNVFTYSSLMDGFCKAGRSSEAIELLEIMVKKRHKPNMITYSTLISGLCKEKKLPKAVEMLDRMKIQGIKPDAALYGKIIDMFCEIRKFHEAANFLDEMILGRMSPNRLTWSLHVRTNNTVVRGLCTDKDQKRAFQMYLSMRSRGISVEPETYDSLVKCLYSNGEMQKGARVFEERVREGCVPDRETWSRMVRGFCNGSEVWEASESLVIELVADSI